MGSVPINISAGNFNLTVTTNSGNTQRVTLNDSAGNTLQTSTGSGERNIISTTAIANPGGLTATLAYSADGGATWKDSPTQTGGPYSIGNVNFYLIVGENGDDSDNNDVVLQFNWKN